MGYALQCQHERLSNLIKVMQRQRALVQLTLGDAIRDDFANNVVNLLSG